MNTTDIVTITGVALTASGLLGRDCAMPITRIDKKLMSDEVLRNIPVFTGHWEDNTVLPVELTQSIDIDTTVVSTDCDVAVVDAALTEGELIAPDMKTIKIGTKSLQLEKLIPAFCRQRNISSKELGMIMNAGGSIDMGNTYAVDFARFALSSVSKAAAQLLAQRILRGDASQDFGFDGLYTQLTNGWEQGSTTVPQYLNQAIVIDWEDLTGSSGATTPDDETVSGKTIDLWGERFDVPVGVNLAELLENYLIPAIERHWTDMNGGVTSWEFHVPSGTKMCMVNTAACIKPCGDTTIYFDQYLRERFVDLRARDMVRLFPSGREVPMLESPNVEAETMWFGPRAIGGDPTYGVFFRNMNEMFGALGLLGSTYGQGTGLFPDNEPLLTDYREGMPFEASAIHQDVLKTSINCVQASIMMQVGVLVTARHLWMKITGVTCSTMLADVKSGVTIDAEPIEGTPIAPTLSTPANNSSGTDTTPTLDWADTSGATSYDVVIATDLQFTDIVSWTNVSVSTYTPGSALALDDYWWKVRARNANGAGAWSATRKLTITS